jgi:hypothetical protein
MPCLVVFAGVDEAAGAWGNSAWHITLLAQAVYCGKYVFCRHALCGVQKDEKARSQSLLPSWVNVVQLPAWYRSKSSRFPC